MGTVVQAPTVVQYTGASISALSISFAATPTAGNSVMAGAAICPSTSVTATSGSDNQSGNSYSIIATSPAGPVSGSYTLAAFVYDLAVNSSGTFTVSINLSGSATVFGHIGALEVSGLPNQAIDASGTVEGTEATNLSVSTSESTASSTAFVVALANIFTGWEASTLTGPTTGYDSRYDVDPTNSYPGFSLGTKTVTSAAVQSGAWAFSNGDDTHGIIAAFGEITYQYTYPASILYNSDGWQLIGGGTVTAAALADGSDGTPDDADGAESPESPSTDVLVFAMTDLTDPNDDTGHRGTLRYKKSAAGGDTMGLVAEWRKGYTNEGAQGTLVRTLLSNQDVSGTITQLDLDLSTGEAATVDYSDLVLRLVANKEATVPIMPTLRAAGTGGASNANGTPIAPGLPSGWQPGDIHFLLVMTNAQTQWTDLTANWTIVTAMTQDNSQQSTKLYWRRAQSGDSAPSISYVSGTALGTSNGLYGRIYGFMDCLASGTPFEDATAGGVLSADATPDTQAIDTTGPQELAVNFLASDDDTAFTSGNPPTNWSNLVSDFTSTTGGDTRLNVMGRQMAAAGNVASVVVGTLNTAEIWRCCTLALLPNPSPRRVQVTWARFRVPEAGSPTYNDSISFAATLAQSQAPVATALPARSEAITLAHAQAPIASGQPTVSFSVTLTQSQAGGVNYAESITFSTTLTQTPAANASALAVLTLPLGLASTHEALASALPSLTFPVTLSQDQAAAVLAGATLNVSITLDYTAEGVQVSLFVESITFGATLGHEIAALVSGQTALAFPVAVTFSPVPTATALRSVTFSATLSHAQTFQRTADNSITYHTTMGHVIAPLVTARPTLTLPATLGFTPLQGQNLIESITFTAHMGMGVSYPWMPEVGQEVTWTKEAGNGGTWTKETQGTVSWSRAGAVGSIWTKEDSIDKEWH